MSWPMVTFRLEGGPNDGEVRLWPGVSVVPPERLVPSVDVAGEYVCHPELSVPWTRRYLWEPEPAEA